MPPFGPSWWLRDGTVSRLDPESGEPIGKPIEVGEMPITLVAREGAVWVANSRSNSVTRIPTA